MRSGETERLRWFRVSADSVTERKQTEANVANEKRKFAEFCKQA
jgi:hypothetical protein